MKDCRTIELVYSPSRFVGLHLRRWLNRYRGWLLLPLGICAILAFIRWEWIVVGFAILLFLYPFVLANLYFKHALNPYNLRFVRGFVLTVADDSFEIKSEHDKTLILPMGALSKVQKNGNRLTFFFNDSQKLTLSVETDEWFCDENEETIDVEQRVLDKLLKNGISFAS